MRRTVRTLLSLAVATTLVTGPLVLPASAAEPTGTVEGLVTWPGDLELTSTDRIDVHVQHAQGNWVRAEGSVDLATGAFRIEGVPVGQAAISFRYGGSAGLLSEWWGDTYVFAERRIVDITAGATVSASAHLERGARITGRLTGGGEPLHMAKVEMTSLDGFDEYLNDHRLVWTRDDGSYQTSWVPPGQYDVRYSAWETGWKTENHNGAWITAAGSDPGPPLSLAAGSKALDVQLDPWGSISGRVTMRTADGVVPVHANINIYVHVDSLEWRWPGWNHWTNPDGTFTIPNLIGRDYRLQFETTGGFSEFWGESPDVGGATSITVVDGQAITGIDVELDAHASMHAQVSFQSKPGAPKVPLNDVSVALMRLDEQTGMYVTVSPDGGIWGQGNYEAAKLRPGTYAVRFVADPYSGIGSEYYSNVRYFYESTDIEIRAGERFDLGEVILEPRYFDVGRLAGADRFATAVEISKTLIPDGTRAPVVYLTNGFTFPDALAAGPAAIREGGVILTTQAGALPPAIADEIRRIDPERVVITGDTNSVSAAVAAHVSRIVSSDTSVVRLGGADRYETAELIVRDAFGDGGSSFAIIATGANYPDALAAGPAAGAYGAPVLLVNGGGRLDSRARTLIADLGVEEVVVAGGEPSVSAALHDDLVHLLGMEQVVRLAGADRYETAALLSAGIVGESDFAFLATGSGFADALTGGPLAGAYGAPLFLSPTRCLSEVAWWGLLDLQVAGVVLLGGEPSLSRAVSELRTC